MPKNKQLELGNIFGRLTVLSLHHIKKYTNPSGINKNIEYYLCKCECGGKIITSKDHLKRGSTKSCGCLSKEVHTKHNIRHTRIYGIWCHIKDRCLNKKYPSYNNYGGRGIKICDEWKESPVCFYNWAINNGYRNNLSIERIDNNGNYEPNNCRWATKQEQNKNQRRTRFITYKGKKQCLTDWANEFGINKQTLRYRLNRGWKIEKAFGLNALLEDK